MGIAAIIDDDDHLNQALRHLESGGVNTADVKVLSGLEGARLLDRSGAGHGLRTRLLRLMQRTAYEGEVLSAHETALKQGHHVIYVPLDGKTDRETVIRVFRRSGGHYLLYFGRWSIEELRF